jgi:hypothetical protein
LNAPAGVAGHGQAVGLGDVAGVDGLEPQVAGERHHRQPAGHRQAAGDERAGEDAPLLCRRGPLEDEGGAHPHDPPVGITCLHRVEDALDVRLLAAVRGAGAAVCWPRLVDRAPGPGE